MVLKLVYMTELREGSYVLVENAACVVRKMDVSKTGKHGASKVRIECIGILDDKKRVIVKPGHEKIGVPLIEKKKGQILNVIEERANIMDMDSYETLEVKVPEEFKNQLDEGDQVEYWDVEGERVIKRKI